MLARAFMKWITHDLYLGFCSRIYGLQSPIDPDEPATKGYSDSNSNNAKLMEVSWVDSGSAGLNINGAAYTTYANVRYRGSDDIGDIIEAILVAEVGNPTKTMDFQLVDLTNGGSLIAEILGYNETDHTNPPGQNMIITPANIPTGPAILGVNAKMNGGGSGTLFTFSLEFG